MSEIEANVVVMFAQSDMIITETAKKLHYSKRTIGYYLDKVKKTTGLNPRNFFDLCELYTIAVNRLEENKDEKAL